MAFIEQRLLDCVSFGTQGGPTFATRKVALRNGIVRRNPLRSRPMYRYNIVYRNLLPENHAEVIAAFNACYGGVFAFRLKDWTDFQATNELLAVTGTGASQNVQLTKTYTFGSESVVRLIRKPVAGTVSMTANGSPISISLNTTTGIATLTASNGAVLRWTGEFDVPVMFEDDALSFSGDDKGEAGLFLTSDVALVEDIGA